MTTEPTEYERGEIAGRLAEKVDGIASHVIAINGSVADTGEKLGALTATVEALRNDIRMDKAAVVVKAETLATDTESRRVILADAVMATDRKWTKRERILGAAGALAALLATVAGLVVLLPG